MRVKIALKLEKWLFYKIKILKKKFNIKDYILLPLSHKTNV